MFRVLGCVMIISSVDLFFFFFKQKTAYEMRISDWSSDVCSSDLAGETSKSGTISALLYLVSGVCFIMALRGLSSPGTARQGNFFGLAGMEIGRAACRESVGQERWDSVGAGSLKKKRIDDQPRVIADGYIASIASTIKTL